MGWRAAGKLNWIRGLRPWPLAWSLNGGRDKKSAAWVLVPYYASEFKRCINERNPFSTKSSSKLENVCVCGKSETNALRLCAVQCHHVIHHKICKKIHLVWSAKGEKFYLMGSGNTYAKCFPIEPRFVQVHATMRSQWKWGHSLSH